MAWRRGGGKETIEKKRHIHMAYAFSYCGMISDEMMTSIPFAFSLDKHTYNVDLSTYLPIYPSQLSTHRLLALSYGGGVDMVAGWLWDDGGLYALSTTTLTTTNQNYI